MKFVKPTNLLIKEIELNTVGKDMLSQSKFYMGYSRWTEEEGRYETWEESVSRVVNMHREKYKDIMTPELEELIGFAEQAYKEGRVLGAQRALQFGGEQIFKHEARMYNCSVSHCDRTRFFQETMYMLLCGCGVGFSVQKHHIAKLPALQKRSTKKTKVFTVPDTIEGWADAFGVLLSSYFENGGDFPEYKGVQVHFDLSKIRPKGALISGGFKAPGPEGLRAALVKCEALIEAHLQGSGENSVQMSPIVAYDFVMFMSDAVLSGGVRRSATICLFSKDDEEMLNAKTGDWFVTNPQRGRSNNSVMLLRNDVTRDEWSHIMKSVKQVGEPGFIFTDSLEFSYNPCVEIGMMPVDVETGESGFQVCNLTELNGSQCKDRESFFRACKAGSILGTLQAGYTNFKYLSEASQKIIEREALIGVSITGWMNNPAVLFDKQNMIDGANVVKEYNAKVADLIGINHAARTTCVKPSGNASVLLGTASGIHGEHSKRYFRNVQMNDQDEVLWLMEKENPSMVELSVWSNTGTDKVVSFPVETKEGSVFKEDLLGVKQLEYVKLAQQYWVEHGTNVELCVHPSLRHNVSNTISVDDWDEVEQYIYDNRKWFAGISLLSAMGDKAYPQAPFTEVLTAEEIMSRYGEASMFASGLIVDGMHAFNNNLWVACDTANGWGLKLDPEDAKDLMKRDWVRRAKKFAANYFNGDVMEMTNCLKDCYNLHKWKSIQRTMKYIGFSQSLKEKQFTEADSMGAQACSGGACEIVW
jgi:ribonucleoside-diphosphate reductase alpha chain